MASVWQLVSRRCYSLHVSRASTCVVPWAWEHTPWCTRDTVKPQSSITSTVLPSTLHQTTVGFALTTATTSGLGPIGRMGAAPGIHPWSSLMAVIGRMSSFVRDKTALHLHPLVTVWTLMSHVVACSCVQNAKFPLSHPCYNMLCQLCHLLYSPLHCIRLFASALYLHGCNLTLVVLMVINR